MRPAPQESCSRLSPKTSSAQPMYRTALLALWYGGILLQAAIAVAMIYRRVWRRFPTFFTYTVFLVVRSLLLLVLRRVSLDAYFYVYWGGELLSWALGLAVIQEVMQQLFAPYQAITRLATVLFRWGAGLLVALAVVVALASSGPDHDRVFAGILLFERSVRVVQVGLLSLLFVLAGFLHLRWPHRVFGIALGLALFTSVELAAVSLRSHTGMALQQTFTVLKPLSFVLAQAVWMAYFALPERLPAAESSPASTMEGWDLALAELLRR